MKKSGTNSYKKIRFDDNIVLHEIPCEDRVNYDYIDKQRSKMRIKEFEKMFLKILCK